MSNKETLQSYNSRLGTNNTTLNDILEVVNSLPEPDIEGAKREVYSTEEQVVGKWIDNKPLYKKTFTQSFTAASDSVTVDAITHGIENVETIFIGGDSFYLDSAGDTYDVNSIYASGSSTMYRLNASANTTTVTFSASTNILTAGDGTVQVQLFYTKTTDEAVTN